MTIVAMESLEMRISRDAREIAAAQSLRYQVFYEEMGALADERTQRARRDVDRFDTIADHILVLDQARGLPDKPEVVGCYRVLRGSTAFANGGFYSAGEFDLSVLVEVDQEILELGRSCVHADYRNGTVMQLLWRGIADYLDQHDIGLMLGCASLPGTDLDRLAPALAYLHANHLAPSHLRPIALPHRQVPLTAGVFEPEVLLAGKRMLPPLLKAYLRMGGMIGDGAVVDKQFNTTDVCLILPTDRIRERYQRHFLDAGMGSAVTRPPAA